MKEIKAFVHPTKLFNIVEALKEEGFDNITLTPSEGTSKIASDDEIFPSLEFSVSDSKVVKLELVCKDDQEEQVVHLIHEKGKTGDRGDGLIYVSEVARSYKVKSGEQI